MFAIELGQDQTVSNIRKRWLVLVVIYPPQLKDLDVRYPAVDPAAGNKSALRLIAGPFSNVADAALVCANLSAKKQSCEQTLFAGEKLRETALSIPGSKPKRRKN